jgi:rhodanese-related sulfurtransferase
MSANEARRRARERLKGDESYAGDVTPNEAWEILESESAATLIDVRTDAEWGYVGGPDLSPLDKKPLLIGWQLFPSMGVNPNFADDVERLGVSKEAPILLLCRSGARSKAAAQALTALGYRSCFNIADGFEGPHDSARHRGTVAGWKASGLPWRQG